MNHTTRNRLIGPGLVIGAFIALGILSWVDAHDQQLEQVGLERYCEDAAVWAYEEAIGMPLAERTGQPDYRGIAAEKCPGMRPAGPAWEFTGQRHLADK